MDWNKKTDQYYIRFAHESDIEPMYQLLSDPEVVRYHPKNAMVVEAQAMDEARRMVMQFEAKEAAFWLIEEKVSGDVIGRIALKHFNWVQGSAELQLDLKPAARNRDNVAEILFPVLCLAFEELALHRIEWLLLKEDPVMPDMLADIGFHHDGQLPSFFEFEGQWIDYQVYSLLQNDKSWQSALLADKL